MTVGVSSHVKIGGHEYLVRPGSYVKRQAPQFGARFTTGDPDFNNLSFWQHWAQQCWVGGVDQDLFADDAMYDEGVGVDTTTHEVMTLGRDLSRGTGSNWTVSSGTTNATQYFSIIYNNTLFVLGIPNLTVICHLWKYDPSTDGWVRITSLDASNMTARSIATFDGKLFIGGWSTAGAPKLVYSSGALSSWTTMTNPAGISQAVYAMRTFQQKLYVAYGTQVWRMKDDQTWDGNTVFYKAQMNSDANYINCMETHLGFLYMGSQNGHIHRTDGNSTFDIWSWDGQTYLTAIKSFDGRLFVMTFEFTNTTDVGQGVLYQMSGSAVTQLKRWGKDLQATSINNMIVYNRRLFYGASNLLGFGNGRDGFGIAIYDPIEDAHSIIASKSDLGTFGAGTLPYVNYIIDAVIVFEGRLYGFARGYGAFMTPYKPPRDVIAHASRHDISAAGASTAPLNGGWFTTSTYDAGTPGVLKLWRKVIIDCTIPTNTSITPEYSTTAGQSYTALTAITTGTTRHRVEFWLNNVSSTSFKMRITLRSTSATATPILHGYVVSYVPTPEPNWIWSMTLVLSESQGMMDGTTVAMDTEAEMAFLSAQNRAKALIQFQDIDGQLWADDGPGVLIYDIEFRVFDMTQPLEGEVSITLLEAVETY